MNHLQLFAGECLRFAHPAGVVRHFQCALDQRMKSLGIFGETGANERNGIFHREKLMTLTGRPARAQRRAPLVVKPGRMRRKLRARFTDGNRAVAGEVQANLDTFGMKTFSPIQILRGGEIVPFEAHADFLETAEEMVPSFADGIPHARLRKGSALPTPQFRLDHVRHPSERY